MNSDYLLVYGTLRNGADNPYQSWFHQIAIMLAKEYSGKLYKIPDTRGAVRSEGNNSFLSATFLYRIVKNKIKKSF